MKIVLQIKDLSTRDVTEQVFGRVPVLIGRSKICDLPIEDVAASRQHCVIEQSEDGRLRLVDLQSANGTLVNGERVEKVSLSVGDSFVVGDTQISLEKVSRASKKEESTVHDLEILAEDTEEIEDQGTVIYTQDGPVYLDQPQTEVEPRVEKPQMKRASVPDDKIPTIQATPSRESDERGFSAAPEKQPPPPTSEVTLKTPTMLERPKTRIAYQTKDWVQVSLFWKGELIDIQCFDRGNKVRIGKSSTNDFTIDYPALPNSMEFLRIQPEGLEINLQLAMNGVLETRGEAKDLGELRKTARQTDWGLVVFAPFRDRLLIEIGPFSFFIQSVRLRLAEPLETPLVKEPFFSGVLASVATFFLVFLVALSGLVGAEEEPEELVEEVKTRAVTVSLPTEPPPQKVRLPKQKPTPKPKPQVAKQPQQKQVSQGSSGGGARASGAEGKRGRTDGTKSKSSRTVGFKTKKAPPKRVSPKGAGGAVKSRQQAKRGKAANQGTGTSRPSNRKSRQAPTKQIKKQVRVEDQGLLGVLGGRGGGGESDSGGNAAGSGLSGKLQGSIEGLARGGDYDSQGAGGRGTQGRDFGGGGSSLEVGGLATRGKGGGSAGFGLGSSGRKGEAEVSFVIEDVEVVDGLTREEIARVVRAHQNEIRACYEKSLIRSGNLDISGRMKVDWFVNRQGKAQSVVKKSAFGSEAGLFDCVSQRIKSWQFPKPRGTSKGAQVSYPFLFKRGG